MYQYDINAKHQLLLDTPAYFQSCNVSAVSNQLKYYKDTNKTSILKTRKHCVIKLEHKNAQTLSNNFINKKQVNNQKRTLTHSLTHKPHQFYFPSSNNS